MVLGSLLFPPCLAPLWLRPPLNSPSPPQPRPNAAHNMERGRGAAVGSMLAIFSDASVAPSPSPPPKLSRRTLPDASCTGGRRHHGARLAPSPLWPPPTSPPMKWSGKEERRLSGTLLLSFRAHRCSPAKTAPQSWDHRRRPPLIPQLSPRGGAHHGLGSLSPPRPLPTSPPESSCPPHRAPLALPREKTWGRDRRSREGKGRLCE